MALNKEVMRELLRVVFVTEQQLEEFLDDLIAADEAIRNKPPAPTNQKELNELESFAAQYGVSENAWISIPRLPKPNCEWCVAGWALVAAGVAAYAAATGGIGVVGLGKWIITTYKTSSTVAHAMAAAGVAGATAGGIARAACPQCN